MPVQQFQSFKFRPDTLIVIERANTIIADYQAQGYQLTLRQLYYQFVSRDLLENTEKNYKKLGGVISDARLAGLIDWDAIEDRTRNLRGLSHWEDPAHIIESAHASFRIDKWENQPNRVEVWVEKDALVGVLERVCDEYDVSYFACRGYVSQSEMYAAARRLAEYIDGGQDVHILHLGDHDPSGIDMTRDIIDRLGMFLRDTGSADINRLALNWEQVQFYQPPPNPAKATDARFDGYQQKFGDESWELDALEPNVISRLIEAQLMALRDEGLWEEKREEERHHKLLLEQVSDRWEDVAEFLEAA